MFILFSDVLNSVFIRSVYLVGCLSYYCGPCLLPSHVILMTTFKKTPEHTQKKTLQENHLESKYMCEFSSA